MDGQASGEVLSLNNLVAAPASPISNFRIPPCPDVELVPQPYLKLPNSPLPPILSLFLCYASVPAPLRGVVRHALLPPAPSRLVSRSCHRPPPLHWTGTRFQMTSCFVVKRRRHKNGIYASLFGVGAPEALVIGVVALLVFGPRGLAEPEVARNLGKTLRASQPTIRELQDVSSDFRSTLEREIGLDEVPPSTNYRPTTMNNNEQPAVISNDKPETAVPYNSEELMKVTEEQLAASASAAWNSQQPSWLEQQETADLLKVVTQHYQEEMMVLVLWRASPVQAIPRSQN